MAFLVLKVYIECAEMILFKGRKKVEVKEVVIKEPISFGTEFGR
jgi:hypothetical protein